MNIHVGSIQNLEMDISSLFDPNIVKRLIIYYIRLIN